MLTLACTPEGIEALRHERLHDPHPRVQRKMEALSLKSQSLSAAETQRWCAISKATYYRYLQEYRTGGREPLTALPFSPRESALQE